MLNYFRTESFKLLFCYLKMYKKYIALGSAFLIASVLLLMPTPLITMFLIDNVIPNKDINMAIMLLIALLIILGAKNVSEFFQSLYFSRYKNLVILKIQKSLIDRIQQLPRSQRKTYHTGYLMSRIIDDPNNLDGMLARSVISLLKDILVFLFGLGILCFLNLKLFLISIIIVPIYYISLKRFSGKIHLASGKYYESQAVVSKKIQESISMIDILAINVAIKRDQIKVIKKVSEKIRAFMNSEIISLKSITISSFISGIGPILVVCIGAIVVMQGNLTLGELIAFNSYLGLLYGPTSRFINSYVSIQKSLSAWDRIFVFLSLAEKQQNHLIEHNISGAICIKQLCVFANNIQILKDINLKIEPNSTIALVGKSGAGKSTLARVIMSLEDSYKGDITFDNIPLEKLNKDYLRRQIGFIEQEPQLISGSIYDNIVLGNEKSSKNDTIEACKIAGIHGFITELEQEYETEINEKGSNISIGQKQRMAIARAIIKKPRLIILDEPTSSLDSENESAFFNKLETGFPNTTKIIIAHNLTITKNADRIYVIDEGEIADQGTHEELISKENSIYQILWKKMHFTKTIY